MGLAALDAVMRRARAAPLLLSLSCGGDKGEAGGDMHTCVYVCGAPVGHTCAALKRAGHGLVYTGKRDGARRGRSWPCVCTLCLYTGCGHPYKYVCAIPVRFGIIYIHTYTYI
jgi:hypothetical protein